MDRDPPVAADRDRRDRRGAAVRHRRRLAARAQGFLGQGAGRRHHPPAAGAAAGGDRLSAADLVRPRGPIGAFLAEHFGIVFSFRWTGAALACGVMGFPLLVRPIRLAIEAIDRKLEEAAVDARRQPLRVFATVTLPLALPGLIAGFVLCFAKALGEFGATITFVSNIPGETQTHLGGDLHAHPGAGRRCGRRPPGAGRDRHLARRAGRRRVARAPRRHALPRGMTMLSVDVEKRLGEFSINVALREPRAASPACSARRAPARPRSST